MNILLQKTANGHSWNKATLAEKGEFCSIQSQAFVKSDNLSKTLLLGLDHLFDAKEESILKIELSSAIGLIVAGLVLTPPEPPEPPKDK